MAQYSKSKSKIEKLGLSEEAIKLKMQGKGSVRIAKALTSIADEDVNATNVDNFFKTFKKDINKNEALVRKVDNAISDTKLKILGQWPRIDEEMNNLLDAAKKIETKMIETREGPVEVEYRDLRLLKDVITDISRITETRARLLGQMQSGVHIHITNIENQYNDLKQIIIDAEEKFPGLFKFVEEWQLQKKENKS